jgi:hypothetical protein
MAYKPSRLQVAVDELDCDRGNDTARRVEDEIDRCGGQIAQFLFDVTCSKVGIGWSGAHVQRVRKLVDEIVMILPMVYPRPRTKPSTSHEGDPKNGDN